MQMRRPDGHVDICAYGHGDRHAYGSVTRVCDVQATKSCEGVRGHPPEQ